MDSTAIYASWKAGLEKTDLNLDSPYNTRVNKGLPPTPINSPGKAALEAAVNPAKGKWLYFVTTNLQTGEEVLTRNDPRHSLIACSRLSLSRRFSSGAT